MEFSIFDVLFFLNGLLENYLASSDNTFDNNIIGIPYNNVQQSTIFQIV